MTPWPPQTVVNGAKLKFQCSANLRRKTTMKRFTTLAAWLGLTTTLVLSSATPARADIEDRLFDFTNAYYRQNGVEPTKIFGRRQANDGLAVSDTPNFSYQRPVRATFTLPAYDHSGNLWFFTVLGGLSASSFTSNSAGQAARQLADRSIEYVFPQRGTNPLGLGALRQSVLLDMRNGYFSNNRLGLWIHVWVSYTDRAFTTTAGKAELADLARRNGRDLDGTPLIRTVGDIDRLYSKGLITKRTAPLSDGTRYAICPVIKDPTDGGIAPDAFLAYTRKPDGSPLEPAFVEHFNSLQKTGDWADSVSD
jgi:hypothetical protein